MKATSRPALLLLALAACASPPPPPVQSPPPAPPIRVSGFEAAETWTAAPASGVSLRLASEPGRDGDALRVDFDFRGGGGWAAFRHETAVALPENYEISFWLKGDAPSNTLELKLIDRTGENVWWINRPEFEFAGEWRRVTFRKRHVTFAWGPARGGEIRDVAAIEFAITAGTGGKGTVWLDELLVTPREPLRPWEGTPVVRPSAGAEHGALVVDADTSTAWRTTRTDTQRVTLDFGRLREFGGIIIDWVPGARAADYDVQLGATGSELQTVRSVRSGGRSRDYIQLPETESRVLSLRLLRPAGSLGYGIREVSVMPLEWGASQNALFETLAAAEPRGSYPKYFGRVQSYWTVLGANGDDREGLLNEEGMLEVDKRAFSIEPFLHAAGRLLTWADARITQSLEDGSLPIPSVTWRAGALSLGVTAWATPDSGASTLWARYRVTNHGAAPAAVRLFLALRPFQVNPSWQFLNNPGGVSAIREIELAADRVRIGGRDVVTVTAPARFGAVSFDGGDVVTFLRRGELPAAQRSADPVALASAALSYPLELAPGESRDVYIAVPWHPGSRVGEPRAELERTRTAWHGELDRFAVELPGAAARIGPALRTALAHVLVNRDGAAIQPGSRSYERSWIRDGSLTSAALLRLGHAEEVRQFIRWFAPHQYADGKVPCCVDHSGAGPVPEHDSHGQLAYLLAEYFRYTGDAALVRELWPHVTAAVAYIDSLRSTRRTAEYRTPDKAPYFGLMPQSISHEGYSEKPMHSYWDDFFTLTGLEDAAFLADTLRLGNARALAALADEFRTDLLRSIELAMRLHGIDYIPGAVELGDFDATSTTVALAPGRVQHLLPPAALRATFERYWHQSEARWSGAAWDAYTPYELRTVGSFIRLGERRRAHALLDWFFTHQRPAAWHQWGEVVTSDPAEPRFIGDMPHTWVGSDFIRSVVDMFAYERSADRALVLAAGVLPEWLGEGLRIRGLRTPYGAMAYDMRREGNRVVLRFDGALRPPRGGFAVPSPLAGPIAEVIADGRTLARGVTEAKLARLPRELVLRYDTLRER